ncbi:hypothetical protein Prum_067440 [Phytohabitans rumicis]|uniref:Uncharacterized protein n=1 Tax=Phytohabitans rumicis TaxID=1076125 RepID=A0A6V8L768_9ACTN|nr:hypothetical protein Prum_067440 [Phytohabitans rumicis]
MLAAQFDAAVNEALRIGGHDFGPFESARLGGTVRGKAVSLDEDHAGARVVIDAGWWDGESVSDTRRVSMLAHELFHSRLNRLRVEAGSTEHHAGDAYTPAAGARWSVRNAVDELRCDLAADSVLKRMFTIQTDQGPRPFPFGMLGASDATSYLNTVPDAFDDVYAQWASLPNAEPVLNPEDQSLVARHTGRLLTLLAHAEAEARSFEMPGPFVLPEIGEHSLAQLLQPPWQIIRTTYDRHVGWRNIDANDTAIADAGQEAILDLWHRFGF